MEAGAPEKSDGHKHTFAGTAPMSKDTKFEVKGPNFPITTNLRRLEILVQIRLKFSSSNKGTHKETSKITKPHNTHYQITPQTHHIIEEVLAELLKN